jgi:hypothetical protein
MRRFTLQRWNTDPWQMYPLALLVWASFWQIRQGWLDGDTWGKTIMLVSVANMVGAGIALFGLHLRFIRASLRMEVCGYISLVWSLFCYLGYASGGSWAGLFVTTSLGIVLTEAVLLSALHRLLWIALAPRIIRWRVERRARRIVDGVHEDIASSTDQ